MVLGQITVVICQWRCSVSVSTSLALPRGNQRTPKSVLHTRYISHHEPVTLHGRRHPICNVEFRAAPSARNKGMKELLKCRIYAAIDALESNAPH